MRIAAFLLVAACAKPAPPPPVLGSVGDFTLTDQTGRAVTSADLAGKVWVADFMFTTCPMICPRLTERLAALDVPGVKKVSFSVDAATDTPAVLTAYAASHHADWTFLTGAAVEGVARDLKVGVDRESGTIIHDTHFVLIDGDRHLRGYYDSSDDDALARLRADAAQLRKSP